MPTILNYKGYRFFFVSFDCYEPMHVHVTKEKSACKFWVKNKSQVELSDNYKFTPIQLNFINRTIEENFELIKEKWDEHCKGIQ